jgi:hypothetical protein
MTLLPAFLNLDKRNMLCDAVDDIDRCHCDYDSMLERLLHGIVAAPRSSLMPQLAGAEAAMEPSTVGTKHPGTPGLLLLTGGSI